MDLSEDELEKLTQKLAALALSGTKIMNAFRECSMLFTKTDQWDNFAPIMNDFVKANGEQLEAMAEIMQTLTTAGAFDEDHSDHTKH